ncbi:uncharacterized protein EI90DRAFT_3123260 [Cantharellus anzutake]|uniref:uncharacterized protein n=1 Tax=Cantharellus anzutake TaxID=1750568 RepID=UPI001907A850|nr:uncharacterized protein EI90DRAFT_3123260 [Cantharellus anzutake]KAF8331686.1 hypothetical protein EI90DRAFT_3123260 [Cantharellus anzutake]
MTLSRGTSEASSGASKDKRKEKDGLVPSIPLEAQSKASTAIVPSRMWTDKSLQYRHPPLTTFSHPSISRSRLADYTDLTGNGGDMDDVPVTS